MRRQFEVLFGFFGRFLPSFTAIGFRARELSWPRLKPDFKGQTWLVTGASGGIGAAIVEAALNGGANVIAVARDADKLARLVTRLKNTGGTLEARTADLSLVADTRALAAQLERERRDIDVLVNNVGVMLAERTTTAEGIETSFATNLLNHYVLTEALIETDTLARDACVISMSSGGMYNVPLSVAMLEQEPEDYDGTLAYAFHKRAQVALTDYWIERAGETARRFYVMHPGWVDTPGVQTAMPGFRRVLGSMLRNEAQGADTAIWLAHTRPDPRPERIWFDRAARDVHVFGRTRDTIDMPDKLATALSRRAETTDPG